ncbi:MAG: TldD/PmbA family protein [Candidatus Thorarchaeota archaeon]
MMMVTENELLDLCKYIVESGLDNGADAIEASAVDESNMDSEVEMGQIKSVNKTAGAQIAIRLYIGKKMGCAFTNIPTKDAVGEALKLAIAAAKATTEDPDWTGFPKPAKYPVVDGLWNEDVVNISSDDAIKQVLELVSSAAQAEEGLIPAGAGTGVVHVVSAYANSSGVLHSEKASLAFSYLVAVAPIENGMTPMTFGFDIKHGTDLDNNRIVNDVAKVIRLCKISAKGKSGKHKVIMHPTAYSQLFNFTLMQSVRGDNVARGKSKIGDKLGEKIASELITIVDDGTDIRGINASIADDEGVPRRRTPIIEEGILFSFLWDSYWSNKMGVKSTGNAKRNRRQGLVEIGTSTIVVDPGTRSLDEILSGIDHGYYIHNVQGAHSSNPESGDFSIVGNPAILIEDGKMVGAIDGLMLSGNVYDLLKNVEEVGKDQYILQGAIGPDIVFNDVDIITKE